MIECIFQQQSIIMGKLQNLSVAMSNIKGLKNISNVCFVVHSFLSPSRSPTLELQTRPNWPPESVPRLGGKQGKKFSKILFCCGFHSQPSCSRSPTLVLWTRPDWPPESVQRLDGQICSSQDKIFPKLRFLRKTFPHQKHLILGIFLFKQTLPYYLHIDIHTGLYECTTIPKLNRP